MKSNYSTILFDFDGTLISSLPVWRKAFHYAFSQFGQKHSDETIVKRCFYRPFEEVIVEFKLPTGKKFGGLVYEGLHKYFIEAELFSGVKKTLTECANLNIKLAVVTSSPRSVVEKALDKAGISQFFNTLVTAEDISNFKPHPEPILLALKRLDSSAQRTLIIGDAEVDMLAGHAAGLQTALFYPDDHRPFYDFDKLIKTNPHFIFNHYDNLDTSLARKSKTVPGT